MLLSTRYGKLLKFEQNLNDLSDEALAKTDRNSIKQE